MNNRLSTPLPSPARPERILGYHTIVAKPRKKILAARLGLPLVWVPPGPFLMGTWDEDIPHLIKRFGGKHDWYERETPIHKVTLPGYWIGRYPVTVAQFRAFVQASGYQPMEELCLQEPDDHPVVYVTWYDAWAFCRWSSERTGISVRLPSEAEWEKAARGTGRRIFPWGNAPPDERLSNFDGKIGHVTPIGQYSPRDNSPYGCADMAGNVWEWTQSAWGRDWNKPEFGYPYTPLDGRENLRVSDDMRRVLRGGAHYSHAWFLRCAYRGGDHPLVCGGSVGFRIVALPRPFLRATNAGTNHARTWKQ
jgi:formylglycine-generating enzyme required for sulfatase activity